MDRKMGGDTPKTDGALSFRMTFVYTETRLRERTYGSSCKCPEKGVVTRLDKSS